MEKQIIEDNIHQLGYDFNHFDLHSFIDHIQKHRGRDIILVPVSLNHEVSALWIRADTADYIFYNNTHHSIHQTHSILHELAHITLDHACIPISDVLLPELLEEFLTSQPLGRPRIATPTAQDSPEEAAAEAFVFAIQKEVMNANRMEQLVGQGSSIPAFNAYVEGMAFDG